MPELYARNDQPVVELQAHDLQDANDKGKCVVIIRNIFAEVELHEVDNQHTFKDELSSEQDGLPHKSSPVLFFHQFSRNHDSFLDTPKVANCVHKDDQDNRSIEHHSCIISTEYLDISDPIYNRGLMQVALHIRKYNKSRHTENTGYDSFGNDEEVFPEFYPRLVTCAELLLLFLLD